MPRLGLTAPVRASLVLALAAVLAAAAWTGVRAQIQVVPEDYGLRPSLGEGAKGKGKGARAAPPKFGSPPGSGAGSTGYVSTNRPRTPPQAVPVQKAPLPARAGHKVEENEATGSVPRRPPRRPAEEDDPYAAVGFRAGPFDVKPSVEIFGGHDDNPFRTANRRGSTFTTVEAKVEVQSNWSRHLLAGELRGAYTRFQQVEGNDRPEAEARLRGRIDVTAQSRIELEGGALLTTEEPGSPDVPAGVKRPPLVQVFDARAGFVQRLNRLELGLRGAVERRTYQDAELTGGGTADRSDRDATAYGLALRGSYEITPGIKPFLEASADRRVFDRRTDFVGVRRGSRGWTALSGIEFGREGWITGEIAAGYAERRYEDPALRDVAGLIFRSSLVWHASGLTKVTLRARSEIDDTTLPGASALFRREASLGVEHAFRRWLIGSASFAYGVDGYVGGGRRDERLRLAAGLTYHLNRHAALKGEVRRERLRSNIPGEDYTANIVMLGLRLQR